MLGPGALVAQPRTSSTSSGLAARSSIVERRLVGLAVLARPGALDGPGLGSLAGDAGQRRVLEEAAGLDAVAAGRPHTGPRGRGRCRARLACGRPRGSSRARPPAPGSRRCRRPATASCTRTGPRRRSSTARADMVSLHSTGPRSCRCSARSGSAARWPASARCAAWRRAGRRPRPRWRRRCRPAGRPRRGQADQGRHRARPRRRVATAGSRSRRSGSSAVAGTRRRSGFDDGHRRSSSGAQTASSTPSTSVMVRWASACSGGSRSWATVRYSVVARRSSMPSNWGRK